MTPFTTEPGSSIASLGEAVLIAKLIEWLGETSPASPYGIGDDCAVLPACTANTQALVTADPVIYGKHFDDSISPEQAAAKLLRRNLSDIAAMGGCPKHAIIALALSPNVSTTWMERFYKTLAVEANQVGVTIVGGDLSSAENVLGAFLTLYGETLPDIPPLLRKTAIAESPIFVTGELGGTRIQKHHAFTPRLSEGQWLAQSGNCTSCTDLSDGLGKDFKNITPEGLSCVIDCKELPVSADASAAAKASGNHSLYHVLNDGEDFELLFTLHPDVDLDRFDSDWSQNFQTKLSRIGTLKKAANPIVLENAPQDLTASGYEHLR